MSVTDGQHKVPISIQRPAPRRLLAHGDARRSRGAAGRAPPAPGPAAAALLAESGPPQPAAPRELPPGAATGRCRARRRSRAGRLKQIQGLHFCRLPRVEVGREEGLEAARARRTSFPLPSLSAVRVTSLYGQRKKNNKENV